MKELGLNDLHASSLNKTSLCRITSQKQNEVLGSDKQIVTPFWHFNLSDYILISSFKYVFKELLLHEVRLFLTSCFVDVLLCINNH